MISLSFAALFKRENPIPSAIVGELRPLRRRGQIVRCNSSTKPRRINAKLSSPPPSQSRRLEFHFCERYLSDWPKETVLFPYTITSFATFFSFSKCFGGACFETKIIIGELRF